MSVDETANPVAPIHSTAEITELLARLAAVPVANVGDAMERISAVDSGIRPMWPGARLVAPAYTVVTRSGDNQAIHEAVDRAAPGDVIVVNGFADTSRAIVGEMLAGRAKMNGLAGFVVDGAIRDVDAIAQLGLPVFARAATPAGPYKMGPGRHQVPVAIGGQSVSPGDIVIGDADGLVVIPRDELAAVVVAAEQIQANEVVKRHAIGAWDD